MKAPSRFFAIRRICWNAITNRRWRDKKSSKLQHPSTREIPNIEAPRKAAD
jgi:hypothetical protein